MRGAVYSFQFLRDHLGGGKDYEEVIALGRPEPVNAGGYSRDAATIFRDIGQINAPYFIYASWDALFAIPSTLKVAKD